VRDGFGLVAAARLNKLIADRLGAAETTVKIDRGRVMEKMGAGSVADLVRMSERLSLQSAPVPSPG
jgi:FixJ family two-component response regulator